MRPDMHKVIVERPRRGGGWEQHRRTTERGRRGDFENAPSYQAMRPHRWFRKEFSDNTRPLDGFLRKNVGRPWNDVFSEVCQIASLDSTIRRHLREHVGFSVELHVVMRDGEPGTFGFGGWRQLRPYRGITYFYVCPRTGLLRSITGPRRRRT